MDATLLSRKQTALAESVSVERVLWLLPSPARGSLHSYKYRYALIANGVCVLRYDNEAGKGDHKHIGDTEVLYHFVDIDQLLNDFLADVGRWMNDHP